MLKLSRKLLRTPLNGIDIYQIPYEYTFQKRFPAFNIPCRNEAVPTDTIFSDTPAIDSGATKAQSFVGKDSLVYDVYPMHSSKQFVNTLEDSI